MVTDEEFAQLRYHLDATAGAQLAMFTALAAVLAPYKGNQLAIASLSSALEGQKAGLLASSASNYKIDAFDETAESLLAMLRG